MKKNLLQADAKEEMASRINKLNPDANAKWGKMNVNQMLRHLNEGLLMAYGDIKSERAPKPWLTQKLMRFVVLNTDMPTPEGKAITFPEIDMVERGINPDDFKAEREALLAVLNNFPAKPTYSHSGLLGKMSTQDWARLNYTHFEHHLKQFGV